MQEGDIVLSLSLTFPNHLRGKEPRRFEIVCDPETMTLSLEEDLVTKLSDLDPSENQTGAADEVIAFFEKEGIDMKDMKPQIHRLLVSIINATP